MLHQVADGVWVRQSAHPHWDHLLWHPGFGDVPRYATPVGARAFAAHAQYPVTVLFPEIADVCAGGFEDPQAQQAEHGHQREVARVGGLPGRGEQGFELQVGEPSVGDSGGTDDRTGHTGVR